MLRTLVAVGLTVGVLASLAACAATGGGSTPDPAALLGEWTLDTIDGDAVDESLTSTIAFAADGSVSGSGGCNRFSGSFQVDGGSISFPPLASTMMACPDPEMALETAVLTAIDGAESWEITGDGALVLEGPTTLVYRPA